MASLLRSWQVWFVAVAGIGLLILVVPYPGVWWVALLWCIPAGVAVGQARYSSTDCDTRRMGQADQDGGRSIR